MPLYLPADLHDPPAAAPRERGGKEQRNSQAIEQPTTPSTAAVYENADDASVR